MSEDIKRKRLDAENQSCLKKYIISCQEKYMDKKSIANRKSAINQFFRYIIGKSISIGEVTHFDIEMFLEDEKNGENSISTICNYYSYLKAFFVFCKKEKYNIDLEFDKVNFEKILNKEFQLFSDDDVDEVFRIINKGRNKEIRLRDEIMFKLLIYTGCTLKELNMMNVYRCKEKSEDPDDDNYIILEEKEIHFRIQTNRILPLPNNIVSLIDEYHKYMSKKIGYSKIPDGFFLFISKRKNSISRLSDKAMQARMSTIRRQCSFSEKELSIKNVRHTLIYKLVNDKQKLDLISGIVGLDVASLKYYFSSKQSFDEEVKILLKEWHPYKKHFEY